MRLTKISLLSLALLLLFHPAAVHAKGTCELAPLMNQHKDVATVQHLEEAWSIAFLQGDTDVVRCLLTPDFTEIQRSGEVKALTDELALAAKNKGKNNSIPDLPKSTVLIHGNVAVAYGISKSTGDDGKPRTTRFADYYIWENGAWHAFFAQQTQLENS